MAKDYHYPSSFHAFVHFVDSEVVDISAQFVPYLTISQMEEIERFARAYIIANTDQGIQMSIRQYKENKEKERNERIEKGLSARIKRPGFVYLCEDSASGLFKIGFTIDVIRREKESRIGNPNAAFLAKFRGTKEDEAYLHTHFSKTHFHGEWFKLSANDVDDFRTYFTNKLTFL